MIKAHTWDRRMGVFKGLGGWDYKVDQDKYHHNSAIFPFNWPKHLFNLHILMLEHLHISASPPSLYIILHLIYICSEGHVLRLLPLQDMEKDFFRLLQDCEAHKRRATLFLGDKVHGSCCEDLGSGEKPLLLFVHIQLHTLHTYTSCMHVCMHVCM